MFTYVVLRGVLNGKRPPPTWKGWHRDIQRVLKEDHVRMRAKTGYAEKRCEFLLQTSRLRRWKEQIPLLGHRSGWVQPRLPVRVSIPLRGRTVAIPKVAREVSGR